MGGRITVVEECPKTSESIPAILSMEHLKISFLGPSHLVSNKQYYKRGL